MTIETRIPAGVWRFQFAAVGEEDVRGGSEGRHDGRADAGGVRRVRQHRGGEPDHRQDDRQAEGVRLRHLRRSRLRRQGRP